MPRPSTLGAAAGALLPLVGARSHGNRVPDAHSARPLLQLGFGHGRHFRITRNAPPRALSKSLPPLPTRNASQIFELPGHVLQAWGRDPGTAPARGPAHGHGAPDARSARPLLQLSFGHRNHSAVADRQCQQQRSSGFALGSERRRDVLSKRLAAGSRGVRSDSRHAPAPRRPAARGLGRRRGRRAVAAS